MGEDNKIVLFVNVLNCERKLRYNTIRSILLYDLFYLLPLFTSIPLLSFPAKVLTHFYRDERLFHSIKS